MSFREESTALLVISGAAMIMASLHKKKKRRRRWWRTELYKKRPGGELMLDLQTQCMSGLYKNFTRMSPTDFEQLLGKIGPLISKQETHLRSPISPQDR